MEAVGNVWETEIHFNNNFGWTLHCTNLKQFLNSRFLQVLLLRLAFSFDQHVMIMTKHQEFVASVVYG